MAALRLRLEEALLYPAEVDWQTAAAEALAAADRLEIAITDLLYLTEVASRDAKRATLPSPPCPSLADRAGA